MSTQPRRAGDVSPLSAPPSEDAPRRRKAPVRRRRAASDTGGESAQGTDVPCSPSCSSSRAPAWAGLLLLSGCEADLFNEERTYLLAVTLFVCGAILAFIAAARAGRRMWVRPIPALEAVDEAVGRATEMGKSVLFVPGIQDINDVQTIAGVTVLRRVAERTADYRTAMDVPTCRSLVMTACGEAMSEAYAAAGRPDLYDPDAAYYVTDEQFGYVAYVTGRMVREEPAACFYMGSFYAESLILAETGNAVGAIQVAGTANPSQLPFFVAACDYTLIGEEFFAASAYLSGSPDELGTLKGQDVGKLLAGFCILLGVTLATAAELTDRSTADPAFDPTYAEATPARRVARWWNQTVLSGGQDPGWRSPDESLNPAASERGADASPPTPAEPSAAPAAEDAP